MKTLYTVSFAALLTARAVNPVAKPLNCSEVGPCVSLGNIAVIADENIANPILRTAQNGALSFKRFFGSETAPIAIVPGGEITADMDERLKAAGYETSLPWMSAVDKESMIESRIREQVMAQTKGMPAEQQDAILKMALAKASALKSGNESDAGDMSAVEQGALTHELGHMWFMDAFKPMDGDIGAAHGYGGWVPDWLDETAAVLLENETLTASRRKAFKTMPLEDFYPLEKFLTMEHPALKSALALNEKYGNKTDSGGSRAIILSGDEAEAFLKASDSDPTNFYTQVRGFADYVIEATGDEQVFAKLALHLSKGGTFESWLSQTRGLQDNLRALKDSWNAYLATR